MKRYRAHHRGRGLKIGVVYSRFNEEVTRMLLDGALEALGKAGVGKRSTTLVSVPGAFELPWAAQRLAAEGGIDAIVCVGAVIRGQTEHFTYVASAAQEGILRVALDTGVPVTFGVLTTETVDQAIERAGGEWGNKGFDAAMDAVELANLRRALG